MLMTRAGTIKDDCIITKITDTEFNVVLNAGCKDTDIAHMNTIMGEEFSGKDIHIDCLDPSHSLVAV